MTLGDLIAGANRGFVSGTLGTPVDIANSALGNIGGSAPVMGSQWIAAKLAALGLLPAAGNSTAEAAGAMLAPSPVAKLGGLLALAKPMRAQEDAAALLASPTVQNLGIDAATSGKTLLDALENYLGRDGALAYLRSIGVHVNK